jgi:hypothetical protein
MELIVNGKKILLTDRVKKAKAKKFKEDLIGTLITILILILLFGFILYHELTKPMGYYAPDYVSEDGVLYDIDGDGDTYHWVDPE